MGPAFGPQPVGSAHSWTTQGWEVGLVGRIVLEHFLDRSEAILRPECNGGKGLVPFDSCELQNCKSDRNSETPDVGRGSPVAAPTAVPDGGRPVLRSGAAAVTDLRNLTVPL